MSAAKHTPGPWSAVKYGTHGRLRVMAGSMPIANVTAGGNTDFVHNARLLASAPDLLDALQGLVAEVQRNAEGGNPSSSYWHSVQTARAAIAKATGAAA